LAVRRTVRSVTLAFGALALAVSGCGPPPATSTPLSKASQLDFTGVWIAVGTFENPAGPPPWSNTLWPAEPSFTPWGEAESRRLSAIRNVVPCQPGGPIFAMWEMGLFPIEILEAPDRIVLKPENSALPRRIFIDGRGHPEDLEPSWMGHSIGSWDGDVLVVDTVGTNGKTRAMNGVGSNAGVSSEDGRPRLPVSDQLHLVERFRIVADSEILEDEMTINDPKAYTSPFTVKHYWQRRPDIDPIEYYCEESPRPDDEANLPGGARR